MMNELLDFYSVRPMNHYVVHIGNSKSREKNKRQSHIFAHIHNNNDQITQLNNGLF